MRTKTQNADKSDGTTFNCQRIGFALGTSVSDRMCWEKRKKPRPLTPHPLNRPLPTPIPSPNRPPTALLSPNRPQVKTTSCFSYNFCFRQNVLGEKSQDPLTPPPPPTIFRSKQPPVFVATPVSDIISWKCSKNITDQQNTCLLR